MTNEQLCCDQEHALLLKETGLMEGVDCDGWFWLNWKTKETVFKEGCLTHLLPYKKEYLDEVLTLTYRLDKILAKLPEWCSTAHDLIEELHRESKCIKPLGTIKYEFIERARLLILEIRYKRGQVVANAAAKLLHLLWKEGLVEVVKEASIEEKWLAIDKKILEVGE